MTRYQIATFVNITIDHNKSAFKYLEGDKVVKPNTAF
jgi:hypothetical protein